MRTQGGRFLLALVLLAFTLRIYRLGGPELWFDEAISANISALGWVGALAHVRAEPFEHPPLYYLLLYAWQGLAGVSEFALRFFSVIWGTLYVPLLYALVRRLADERLARLTAVLGCLSPFLIAYSQEVRMYSLLPCLAVVLLLSLSQAMRGGNRPGWWLVYGAYLAVGIATQYFFVLLWLATIVHVGLTWRKRRKVQWWGVAVQTLPLVGAAIWLVVAPGLRASLLRLAQGEAAFGPVYKLSRALPGLLLGESGGEPIPPGALALTGAGWVLVLLGLGWSRRRRAVPLQTWQLFVLCLAVPVLGSLLVPYGVLGRHLGYTLSMVFTFMALGLLALRRRGEAWLGAAILVVVSFVTLGLVNHYTVHKGDFGQAMAYIDKEGLPGDVLILTQPAQRQLVAYYNRRGWPVAYLPELGATLTPAGVEEAMQQLSRTHSRLWLGPTGAWTSDPDALVERWLADNAYPAEKAWFSEGSSVTLYFTSQPLEAVPLGGAVRWEGRLRLLSVERSSPSVAGGDALRLSLTWRGQRPIDSSYLVSLALVDETGAEWAIRQSEPCGGLCPTNEWREGVAVRDHHALLVPPGTPPGPYHLELAWYAPAAGRELTLASGGQRVDLGEIEVIRNEETALRAFPDVSVQNSVQAEFGGEIALLGVNLPRQQAQAGQTVHLTTHWLAAGQPTGDYELRLELVGADGQVQARRDGPVAASFFPTTDWEEGEYVRGLQTLGLPSGLAVGGYWLRLTLLDSTGQPLPLTGSRTHRLFGGLIRWRSTLQGSALDLIVLRVSDRARRFDLPAIGNALHVQLAQKVALLGYDLSARSAVAGGQIDLTLYWRGGGPTDRPYKVFTHLGDGVHPPVAQQDGPPGEGCCPTDTWREGEVVVDRHTIFLPADLPPGTYWLTVGLYDESSRQRLPVVDADGLRVINQQSFLTQITVAAATPPSPAHPSLDLLYRAYLPLVEGGK